MGSDGQAFRHYIRLGEGNFKRLAAKKYSAFVRGDEALDRGSEPDVKIATVMLAMAGRRAVRPPDRCELVRYRVHEDGRIDRGFMMDRVTAILMPDKSDGNLIRAERRFHDRAATWKLTEFDRVALANLAAHDAGFDGNGARRKVRTKQVQLYAVRFQFFAFNDNADIDGHFEALIRASSRKELDRRARELAEQERSRGHIPWEAEVEMTFVARIDPDDLASRRAIVLGGALLVYPSAATEGLEWPPGGQVRDDDEPTKILDPKPLTPRRAAIEMHRHEKTSGMHELWVIRVTNLPQYPYEASFYRYSEHAALKLERSLRQLIGKPLAKNPRFPEAFQRERRS
jgi:hypothetical protein